MKKTIILLVVALIMISAIDIPPVNAGSGFVSISGPSSVNPGGSATYNVTISISGANTALATISCGGAFSGGSVNLAWQSSNAGANENATMSGSISVRASSSGGTGTISVSGSGSSVDASYDVTKFSYSGSKSASVPTPTAVPTPSPTSVPTNTPKPTAKPTETPVPTDTPPPTATPEPTPTPSSTPEKPLEWADVPPLVDDMGADELNISMGDKTVMPKSVLQSLKDNGTSMTISFKDFSCKIDGASLGDDLSSFETLNLNVTMEKDETLSSKFDGKDVFQLHFSHKGQLPGPIEFKFKAEGKNPGDELYLYYLYEKAGIIEAKQKVIVDEDGYFTVVIYHCSSYVITDTVINNAVNYNMVINAKPESSLSTVNNISKPKIVAQEQPQAIVTPTEQIVQGVPFAVFVFSLIIIAILSTIITFYFTKIIFTKQNSKENEMKV